MLGQMALFLPKGKKLKHRVQVKRVQLSDVRYMLENFHYLKRTKTGRQLNYAVLIDGIVDGVITYAYPLMSADLCGIPSDELVEFGRMWLKSNIPHSATCAIAKTLRRIKNDWATCFPDAKPIRLVVSWSDTTRHKGTIYKAANFQWVKRTKGKPPGNKIGSRRLPKDGTQHADYNHDKDCWIYWLDPT